MTFIKTISNGWCASHSFHEPARYSCLFGCRERDELRHYLVCPVMLDICASALHIPVNDRCRSAPSVLSSLALSPVNIKYLYLVYVMFSVYHAHKRDWDTNRLDKHIITIESTGTSQNKARFRVVDCPGCVRESLRAVARGHVAKLEDLLRRSRHFAGSSR